MEIDLTVDDLEQSVKRTDERLDKMAWKIDTVEKEIAEPNDNPEVSVVTLLKSVSEVRNDYQNLRKEILEVQALQRELSSRLRQQLQQVQGKFVMLKEKLAGAPPH